MAFITSLPTANSSLTSSVCSTCRRLSNYSAHDNRARARSRIFCVATSVDASETEQLVDKLLLNIRNIDGGPLTRNDKKVELDELINRIIKIADMSNVDYLTDPLIFNNFNVAYTGGGRGNSAAGGAFRSAIGRLFFVPRGAFQHLYKPNVAVNLVAFRLLGFINGCVGLYGKFCASGDIGRGGLLVHFQKPRIRIGWWTFVFSNESEVKLRIAYLDNRVRIAVGGRGSLFVFTRGGKADLDVGNEWKLLFGENVNVRSQQSLQLFIGLFVGIVGGVLVSIFTNFVQMILG